MKRMCTSSAKEEYLQLRDEFEMNQNIDVFQIARREITPVEVEEQL